MLYISRDSVTFVAERSTDGRNDRFEVPRSDIHIGQVSLLAPLIVLMFVIGLDPALLTNLMTSLGQIGLAH